MSKRVQVILTDAEYKYVKQRAGLVPLSAWFRNMAIGSALTVAQIREARDELRKVAMTDVEVVTTLTDAFEASVTNSKKPRCVHGALKGENCWQCGGLAVMG